MLKSKIKEKKRKLEEILKKSGKILIAYSGGVDSTFLLKMAVDCVGVENTGVFIEKSEVDSDSEIRFARDFANSLGVKTFFVKSSKLDDCNFSKNPVDRCFFCKKELFSKMAEFAKKHGYNAIADGSNYDDKVDYRPGSKAKSLYNVISPLQMAGLTKEEIRLLSRRIGLPTWNKPQMACFASRIPYGEEITEEKLKRIMKAEEYLYTFGLKIVRVRDYGNLCRIEVAETDFKKILKNKEEIVEKLKKTGYLFITLDLEGYRTGSLNKEILMDSR